MSTDSEQLKSLMEKFSFLDTLILQHVNYLNKLEESIKQKGEFAHTKPTDCNFGKILYNDVWPMLDKFPDDIKQLVKEIEESHKQFHNATASIDPKTTTEEKVDPTVACMLILKLYKLEDVMKKYMS